MQCTILCLCCHGEARGGGMICPRTSTSGLLAWKGLRMRFPRRRFPDALCVRNLNGDPFCRLFRHQARSSQLPSALLDFHTRPTATQIVNASAHPSSVIRHLVMRRCSAVATMPQGDRSNHHPRVVATNRGFMFFWSALSEAGNVICGNHLAPS